MLRVDHVVRAVPDLDREGERLLASFGLASVAGGVHPGWGTANRIVPLGATYLELIAVADPGAAAASVFGRAVAERASDGGGWLALCLADDHLEATARRLSLEVRPGARTLPDGRTIRWRGAGLEDPRRTPDLPFFIAWGSNDLHPGRTARRPSSGCHVPDEDRSRWRRGALPCMDRFGSISAVSFVAREPARYPAP